MSKETTDEKLDDILRKGIKQYIENWAGTQVPNKEHLTVAVIDYKLTNDSNFGTVAMAYVSLRRQELNSREQAKLQRWLIIFAGISAIAVAIPVIEAILKVL